MKEKMQHRQDEEKQDLTKMWKLFHKNGKKKKNTKNREFAVVTYSFLGLFLCLRAILCILSRWRANSLSIIRTTNGRSSLRAASCAAVSIPPTESHWRETVTDAEGNETRKYPAGRIFAHVVGYSTHGTSGIEAMANFNLRAPTFCIWRRRSVRSRERKIRGTVVTTTLNYDLRFKAYDALGSYDGAVVVMEPETGRILAMVSKPDSIRTRSRMTGYPLVSGRRDARFF